MPWWLKVMLMSEVDGGVGEAESVAWGSVSAISVM